MNKKNLKTIILLLCVLAVLVLAWVLVRALNPAPSTDPGEQTVQKLTEQRASHLLSLTVTSVEGTELKLRSFNGLWKIEDDLAFPLSQKYASSFVAALCSSEAIRTMQASDVDLPAAGLEPARFRITALFQSGTEEVFSVGADSASAGGLYVRKGENVYLTDPALAKYLGLPLAAIAEVDTIPPATGIISIQVEQNGESTVYTEQNEADRFRTWMQIAFDAAVDYAPDAEKMKAYGLDEASRASVTVKYLVMTQIEAGQQSGAVQFNNEYTAVLYIGARTEQDASLTYVQLGGSNLICTMKTQFAQTLLQS